MVKKANIPFQADLELPSEQVCQYKNVLYYQSNPIKNTKDISVATRDVLLTQDAGVMSSGALGLVPDFNSVRQSVPGVFHRSGLPVSLGGEVKPFDLHSAYKTLLRAWSRSQHEKVTLPEKGKKSL